MIDYILTTLTQYSTQLQFLHLMYPPLFYIFCLSVSLVLITTVLYYQYSKVMRLIAIQNKSLHKLTIDRHSLLNKLDAFKLQLKNVQYTCCYDRFTISVPLNSSSFEDSYSIIAKTLREYSSQFPVTTIFDVDFALSMEYRYSELASVSVGKRGELQNTELGNKAMHHLYYKGPQLFVYPFIYQKLELQKRTNRELIKFLYVDITILPRPAR